MTSSPSKTSGPLVFQLTFPQLLGNYCLYPLQLFHRIEKEHELYLRRLRMNLNTDGGMVLYYPLYFSVLLKYFILKRRHGKSTGLVHQTGTYHIFDSKFHILLFKI